jgi:hypothetical protein
MIRGKSKQVAWSKGAVMEQREIGQDGGPPSFLLKFLIGTFAGVCAAFFPRVVAFLALESGQDDKLRFLFPISYILVGLLFALVIGGVIAILEHKVSRHLGQTFLTALGIPALLSGALNSSTASKGAEEARSTALLLQIQNDALVKQLAKKENIPILDLGSFRPTAIPESSSSLFFSSAYASQTKSKSDDSGTVKPTSQSSTASKKEFGSNWGESNWGEVKWGVLGVEGAVKPTDYLLILDQAASRAEADKKLEKYKVLSNKVTIIQIRKPNGDMSFMITDGNVWTSSKILNAAVQAKEEFGARPAIFPTAIGNPCTVPWKGPGTPQVYCDPQQ